MTGDAISAAGTVTDITNCGSPEGGVVLDVQGTGPFTFSWTKDADPTVIATTQNLSGISVPGDYTVVVDNGTCSLNPIVFTINGPTPVTITETITNISTCGGTDGSIATVVTDGSGNYDYTWTYPNGTTVSGIGAGFASITNLDAPGFYTLEVLDVDLGCSVTEVYEVTEPIDFTVDPFAVTDISTCGAADGSITGNVTGGSGDFTFLWNYPDGQIATTLDITGLSVPGNYTITITDNVSGCTYVGIETITDPVNFTIAQTVTSISTCGGSDGAIALTIAGGSGNYNYSWTGPGGFTANTEDINGLSAVGNYSVTVTDVVSGCSTSRIYAITDPADFAITGTTNHVSTCGGNDGSITLSIINGSGDFSFAWTGPAGFTATTQNITALTDAGTYTVVTTDNVSGCSASRDFSLVAPAGFVVSLNTLTPLTCGNADGAIEVDIVGASVNRTIAWTGPNGFTAATQNITGLADFGDYTITVTDDDTGCVVAQTYNMPNPAPFTVAAAITDETACAANDGEITLTVSAGGSGDYTFQWAHDGGLNSNVASNLAPGAYNVRVLDNITGCFRDESYNVAAAAPNFAIAGNVTDIQTCGGSEGAVQAVVTGGSGIYNYTWFDPNGDPVADPDNDGNITGLSIPGLYIVTVTDLVSNCTDSQSFNVSEPVGCGGTNCGAFTVSVPEADLIRPTCNGFDDGKIVFYVTGGSNHYTFTLSSPASGLNQTLLGPGPFEFTSLTADDYEYTILDNNTGDTCGPLPYTLEQETVVQVNSVTNITDSPCYNQPFGTVTVGLSGGTLPYEYSTDNGATWVEVPNDNIIKTLHPNPFPYNVLVRDNAADVCPASFEVTVNNLNTEMTAEYTATEASCDDNDGSATVSNIQGGTGNYTYRFDGVNYPTLPAGGLFGDLAGGDHIFTIIDDSGCEKDITILVPFPGLVDFQTSATDAACEILDINDPDEVVGANGRIFVSLPSPVLGDSYLVGLSTDVNFEPDFIELPYSGWTFKYLTKGTYYVTVITEGNVCPNKAEVIIDGPDVVSFEPAVQCSNFDDKQILLTDITGASGVPFLLEVFDRNNPNFPIEQINFSLSAGNEFLVDGYNFLSVPGDYRLKLRQSQSVCGGTEFVYEYPQVVSIFERMSAELVSDPIADKSLPERGTGQLFAIKFDGGVPDYVIRSELVSPTIPGQEYITEWDSVKLNNNLQLEYIFTDAPAGEYLVEVRDAQNCRIELTGTVALDTDLFIPNIFTPNGDGYNDVFFLRNKPDNGVNLVITNRWGKVVYSSSNYDNDWTGDGIPDGVYYYNVSSEGQSKSGWVEILRGKDK